MRRAATRKQQIHQKTVPTVFGYTTAELKIFDKKRRAAQVRMFPTPRVIKPEIVKLLTSRRVVTHRSNPQVTVIRYPINESTQFRLQAIPRNPLSPYGERAMAEMQRLPQFRRQVQKPPKTLLQMVRRRKSLIQDLLQTTIGPKRNPVLFWQRNEPRFRSLFAPEEIREIQGAINDIVKRKHAVALLLKGSKLPDFFEFRPPFKLFAQEVERVQIVSVFNPEEHTSISRNKITTPSYSLYSKVSLA